MALCVVDVLPRCVKPFSIAFLSSMCQHAPSKSRRAPVMNHTEVEGLGSCAHSTAGRVATVLQAIGIWHKIHLMRHVETAETCCASENTSAKAVSHLHDHHAPAGSHTPLEYVIQQQTGSQPKQSTSQRS